MKTIRHRAYFALIIALALFAGLVFFVFKYATKGEAWAMHPANANIFHDGVLDVGSVTDRNGTVLAKAENGVSSYGDDPTVRKACFHAVGDYGGNIGSGALTAFNSRLAGYDLVGGVSSLEGRGGTVKLSIDADLNTVAYNALNGRRGAVLVSNYKTGEILCEVSTPAFDPNSPPDITKSEYEGVYINRCLGAAYAPGSVFKLVTLAAAIEEIP
ncbi:MAG: penicillin-binding transpeptidase domain-containing protein, partial [Oscillospiraceae bacterium]